MVDPDQGQVDGDPVLDLLERWEALRVEGTEVSAEELCRDYPGCLASVRRGISALKAAEALMDAPHAQPPAREESPGVLAGRYKPLRPLGQGGFGHVWVAFDEVLHREVAIKVPLAWGALAEPAMEQFLTEARCVAGLRHPGIVPVHDVIREGNRLHIVSEWVDGEDLARAIARKRFTRGEAVAIGMRVAEVLEYAHQRGIVHRDIKPSNLLLDGQGRLRLCDFGIAGVLGGQGDGRLTLPYASPERLASGRVDHRSDIWSLGVVLFELATGKLPFQAPDPIRLAEAIRSAPVPEMPDIPAGLASVIRRCLEKNPNDRHQTARAARDALAGALRETPAGRAGRVLAVVAGLGVILAAAQLAVSAWRPAAPRNLVHNGDFSEGNRGFATSYIHSPDEIGLGQGYAILRTPVDGTSSPHEKGDFGDHTSGNGLMMVVNGSADPDVVVWSQDVPVEPGTVHEFELWVASWHSANPAIIEARINSRVVGTIEAPVTTGVWLPLRVRWDSGLATSARIEIIDARPEDIGSDFALDDISLKPTRD